MISRLADCTLQLPTMRMKWKGLLLFASLMALTIAQDAPAPSLDDTAVSPMKSGTTDDDYNNIAFDLPDLTATIVTPHGEQQLEAYKSVYNDEILRQDKVPKASQLIWVSVGKPTFVKTKISDNGPKLFHLQRFGFYASVEMLSMAQRQLLAATASAKYGMKINETQIVNLVLSKFECSAIIYEDDGRKYLIKGKVSDFRNFPLRMDFIAPPYSVERRMFWKYIEPVVGIEDLQFTCSMASKGKKMLTNTLTITSSQSEQIGLQTKLFGPSTKRSDSVYVTREQSSALSREMYSTLNIYEDYEIPETQFAEAFVNDFIKQVASQSFTFVPIDEALAAMSVYGFDFSDDLRPDVIKRELGEILKVDKRGEKSRIIVDETVIREESGSVSVSNSRKRRRGLFGGRRSVQWGINNSKRTYDETRSLNDQLHELNTESRDEVKWDIEGTRVIPKSLNVAKLSHSNFEKTLVFSHVRVKKVVAPFDREFSLYTSKITVGRNEMDQVNAKLSAALEKMEAALAKFAKEQTGYIKGCRICIRHYASRDSVCSRWSNASTGSAMSFPSSDALYYYTMKVECA